MDSLNNVSDSANNLEDIDAANTNYPVLESSNNNGSEVQNQNDHHEINATVSSLGSSTEMQLSLEALRNSSHEVSTQATSPQSMLLSATPLAGSLRIITSLTSAGPMPQRELLAVNTDYSSSSSGACSLLLGVVEQNNQPHHKLESRDQNVETIQIDTSELSDLPHLRDQVQRRNRFIGRSQNRQWMSKCCNNTDLSETNEDNEDQPYSRGPPPSYSSIYRPISNQPILTFIPLDNQSSFESPAPPPSYAQAERICMASYSVDNLISVSSRTGRFMSSQSTAVFCPRCATFVPTFVDVHRSVDTHVIAFILFMCGCWPCCMIPYCLDSCQTVDHYCPICRYHLGTYTPM